MTDEEAECIITRFVDDIKIGKLQNCEQTPRACREAGKLSEWVIQYEKLGCPLCKEVAIKTIYYLIEIRLQNGVVQWVLASIERQHAVKANQECLYCRGCEI